MKSLTVRLPEPLVTEIARESRERGLTTSDVIRERLKLGARTRTRRAVGLEGIADLIGSIGRLPADLSQRKKRYLETTGYGRKRSR
jgi:Arc/MetJ-type ribon-helix-helix transcriptional regulator